MKKILFMMVAMLGIMSNAFAQTVEGSRTFENIYVGVNGGVLSPLTTNESFLNDLRPVAGIELGKDFTPVIGVSVEALAAYNTTPSPTFIDQSNVIGNFKVNLSNWFGGYKGQPRVFEVLAVPAIGWGHNYGDSEFAGIDRNYVTFNPGAQINVNLGKARAWQLNVKPSVVWRTNCGTDMAVKDNGAVNVRFGVTYKFGSRSKKSHNFVLGYTGAQYAAMVAERDAAKAAYDSLKARGPVKEIIKETVIKEKETIVEKSVVKPSSTIITFAMGSSELVAAEAAKVKAYASQITDNATVIVTGSADSATGTKARNEQLANERAEAVVKVLKANGVNNVTVKTQFDTNDVAEASRAAVVVVE